jgi:N-acetylglutamate synthase-like GNAT family acetyltransferase
MSEGAATDRIEIRPMRPEDLPAAMAVLERWNMAPLAGRADAERSEIVVENSFVAERAGRVVGTASYLMLGEGVAETASLAVDPQSRGSGLGYRLQVARLEAMWRRGVRHVRTEADRPETIRWYTEKFGYRRVGTNPKKHAFSLPDVDEWVVLELDLERWVQSRNVSDPPPQT